MKPLSNKSRAVLAYIQDFIGKYRYPPTYEEIRQGVGLSSKSLVDYHLTALEEHKLITRQPQKPRGIKLRTT